MRIQSINQIVVIQSGLSIKSLNQNYQFSQLNKSSSKYVHGINELGPSIASLPIKINPVFNRSISQSIESITGHLTKSLIQVNPPQTFSCSSIKFFVSKEKVSHLRQSKQSTKLSNQISQLKSLNQVIQSIAFLCSGLPSVKKVLVILMRIQDCQNQ